MIRSYNCFLHSINLDAAFSAFLQRSCVWILSELLVLVLRIEDEPAVAGSCPDAGLDRRWWKSKGMGSIARGRCQE